MDRVRNAPIPRRGGTAPIDAICLPIWAITTGQVRTAVLGLIKGKGVQGASPTQAIVECEVEVYLQRRRIAYAA